MLKFLKNVKTNGVKISFGDFGEMVDFETGLDEFSKIGADLSIGDLNVVEGERFFLKYRYPEKLQPEFEVANGTLVVKTRPEIKISVSEDFPKEAFLTISVPVGTRLEDVRLEDSMGNVTVSKVSSVKLNVEDSMGDINVNEASFSLVDIADSMGKINVTDIKADELKGSSSMGGSVIDACDIAKIKWESSMGKVNLRGTFGSLDIENSMGDIIVDGESSWTGTLETSMGKVVVDGVKHGDSYSR